MRTSEMEKQQTVIMDEDGLADVDKGAKEQRIVVQLQGIVRWLLILIC